MEIDSTLTSLPLILSPTSLHDLLASPRPVKRPRAQDDPFFQEGTYEYKAAWLCLQAEEMYVSPPNDLSFFQRCHQGLCHGQYTFHSMTAYEHHYETNHRYICLSCKKPFPSQKFLDIHLREVHDMLVRIRRERGEKTYQCFVEGCDRVCSSSIKRRMHLIDKHKYPKQFNFDIVFSGVLPLSQRIKDAKRRQVLKVSRELQHQQSSSMDIDTSLSHERTDSIEHHVSSKSRRVGHVPRFPSDHRTTQVFNERRQRRVLQQDRPNTSSSGVSSSACASSGMDLSDVDMEGLEHRMALLMVPRSVARKIARK